MLFAIPPILDVQSSLLFVLYWAARLALLLCGGRACRLATRGSLLRDGRGGRPVTPLKTCQGLAAHAPAARASPIWWGV